MKSVLLVGLGRFGRHMAQKLRNCITRCWPSIRTSSGSTTRCPSSPTPRSETAPTSSLVRSLGVRNFDLCVVAIGDNFQSSLETTALLKECGAPFVLARAARDIHAKFLLRNGADDVIYPERQMASWSAVRYTADHIFDYVELTPEYSIFETGVPRSWVGKTVVELAVRQRYHINILATRSNQVLEPLPGPTHCFTENETIFILGANKDVQKFLRMA